MKLEIGKSYTARNGGVVKITAYDETNIRCFGGFLPNRGSCFFTEQGQYILGKQSKFDIIKEYDKN